MWSPTNAKASVLSVINGSRHTLAIEDEEMDDPAVTADLAAAARRGVHVTITMTADSEWDTAFAELARSSQLSLFDSAHLQGTASRMCRRERPTRMSVARAAMAS